MIYQRGEKPIKVLLVEDDEDDFLLAKDLFEEIGGDGYELEWVRSFDDALSLENTDCYDICLLDYRLGEHDGIELMSELRARGFNCPMILLTGQGDVEVDRMATVAGASDYLVKGQISRRPLNAPFAMRSSSGCWKTSVSITSVSRRRGRRQRPPIEQRMTFSRYSLTNCELL